MSETDHGMDNKEGEARGEFSEFRERQMEIFEAIYGDENEKTPKFRHLLTLLIYYIPKPLTYQAKI